MSEGEQPGSDEMGVENPTVTKVKDAVDGVWDKSPSVFEEYKDIRKEMQSRLAWHGGGVYRRWVQDIDSVSKSIVDINKKNPLRHIAAGINSGAGRLWAASGSLLLATADVPINVVTWPLRRFGLFPKDIVKRSFLTLVDTMTASYLFVNTQHKIGRSALEASTKIRKGVAETIVTAPEVAVTLAKRRVDTITDKILRPKIEALKKK